MFTKMTNEEYIKILENAIRKHRDYRSDDRCWMDDEELYKILPEGYTPPARDCSVELENCKKYIESRHNPATEYISPELEIEHLRLKLALYKQSFIEIDNERRKLYFEKIELESRTSKSLIIEKTPIFEFGRGCITSYFCEKCNTKFICDTSREGQREGDPINGCTIEYISGPCCCVTRSNHCLDCKG